MPIVLTRDTNISPPNLAAGRRVKMRRKNERRIIASMKTIASHYVRRDWICNLHVLHTEFEVARHVCTALHNAQATATTLE